MLESGPILPFAGGGFPDPDVQGVLETLHQPFLVLDARYRVLAASTRFYEDFGLTTDSVIGRPLFALDDGGWDVPALRALLDELAAGRERVEGFELEHDFGRLGRRTLSFNVRAVREAESRVRAFLVSIGDETGRRPDASPASGDEAPRPRIVTDDSVDLVLLHGADGALRYASESAATILGFTPAELLAAGVDGILHPDDADAYRRFFLDVRGGGASQGLAYRVRRKGGEYVWLGCTARPVRDDTGAVVQVQLVGRDVTHRKRAEEARHWLGRQVRMILDSAGDGIFGLDLAGNVTFVNPAAARTLGYAEGDLVGRPHHAAFHHRRADGDAHPAESCAILSTLGDGEARTVTEDVFCRRDGSVFAADYTVTPALEGERIVGAVVTFRDVTARREAETTLRRAEWLEGIGQTVLAVRHEINNPLTTMLADAALLEMEGNTPEEEREMIRSIVRQAKRIRDVVQRLAERKDSPSLRQMGASRMLDLSDSAGGASSPS